MRNYLPEVSTASNAGEVMSLAARVADAIDTSDSDKSTLLLDVAAEMADGGGGKQACSNWIWLVGRSCGRAMAGSFCIRWPTRNRKVGIGVAVGGWGVAS